MAPYVREKALKRKIKSTQKKKRELVTAKQKKLKDKITEIINDIDDTEANNIEKSEEIPKLTCELDENKSFGSLSDILSEKTLSSIKNVGLNFMTPIQASCIPMLLKGNHLRATAKTGSGKTLAFLIPVIEIIQKLKFKPQTGTGVIIISPTRELTMQTYGVLKELAQNLHQTIDILMGGNTISSENKQLTKGANIIVSTPRRLIYHLQNTKEFIVKNCFCIVLDEADRLIDGFEEELKQIFKHLPNYRQTVLFSATKNEKIGNLASIVLPEGKFTDVDIDHDTAMATVSTLEQAFILYPTEKKFNLFLTFLKLIQDQKAMVFFNCCEAVKFYNHLFNYTQFPVMCIHGNQERPQRNKIFHKFSNSTSGILFCTDIAARGWDIPVVDWIIQYDPPSDTNQYIHRVGRTARAGASGKALLFLDEEEIQFIQYLREAKVDVIKKEISWSIVDKIDFQEKFEQVVADSLHLMAKEAFRSFIRAYKNHKLKDAFNVNHLNIKAISKCFGFRKPPVVKDIINGRKESNRKRKITPTENNYGEF